MADHGILLRFPEMVHVTVAAVAVAMPAGRARSATDRAPDRLIVDRFVVELGRRVAIGGRALGPRAHCVRPFTASLAAAGVRVERERLE